MEMPHDSPETRETIRKIALINAVSHQGKAQPKPVLGKLLGERPDLRKRIAEISSLIEEIVQEVNGIPLEKQTEIVKKSWPEALGQEKEKVEEKVLPPLPNVEKYGQVVTRYAPNPDCVLHLGGARAIILSHDYARIYQGRFILRFEDTDPRLKKSALQFFDLIRKDLEWLGCKWDAEYIQSDRLDIYYEYAEKLLKDGNAYVCTCIPEEFRDKVMQKKPCPCRDLKPEENLARWEAMQSGKYAEHKAVVRIKTDLEHPNPAIRDWPAFRVINVKKYRHPRVGTKYRVWPLYNFAAAIDDHLMRITHVIRGKEHLTNQRRQEYLYRYFGWKYPEAIHYGRLKIVGAPLSKSKILKGVQDGTYSGWDDPRLATFLALRRRGIMPEAIRRLMVDIGPRPVDITLSWENLYAYNRKIVDPMANRYFFVQDPVKLSVKGVKKGIVAHVPLHPDDPTRGSRTFEIKAREGVAHLLISRKDAANLKKGSAVRLMELFNVQLEHLEQDRITAEFHSTSYEEARRLHIRLIHWLPETEGIQCEVVMPDGSTIDGLAEKTLEGASRDQIVQFERFGFVRLDDVNTRIVAFFAHR